MLHSKRFFGLLVLATSCGFAVHTAGCGDDDNTNPVAQDAGQQDTSTPIEDSGNADTSTADAADAFTGPVFLDPSAYSDLFTIDASFAFGVTQRHAADGTIGSGVKWGATGPIVTGFPTVTSWAFPTDPKGAATSTAATATAASGLPASPFYGADGFVLLPFGSFALESYTAGGSPFRGEALLYNNTLTTVSSRAKTNGFYSGVGVTDGTTNAIVYSGLSTLSDTDQATNDNGLYGAPLCAGQLLPTGTCAASHKLFGWAGSSGPVVADVNGNVFVAASLNAGGGELDGLTKTQALGTGAATQVSLASDDSLSGTGSLTAVAAKGATTGWLVAIGFADFMTGAVPKVFATDYKSDSSGLAKGTHAFASVITPNAAVTGIALFSDNDGNLWLAVTTATTGAFLELEPKP